LNERIKKLRKMLELTQQEFADRVGMKRNTIANYETARNEPSNSVISLICREFHVNETWLRTGKGEVFNRVSKEDELMQFFDALSSDSENSYRRRLVSVLARLDESHWHLLEDMAFTLLDEFQKETVPSAEPTPLPELRELPGRVPAVDAAVGATKAAEEASASVEPVGNADKLPVSTISVEDLAAQLNILARQNAELARQNAYLQKAVKRIQEEDALQDSRASPSLISDTG